MTNRRLKWFILFLYENLKDNYAFMLQSQLKKRYLLCAVHDVQLKIFENNYWDAKTFGENKGKKSSKQFLKSQLKLLNINIEENYDNINKAEKNDKFLDCVIFETKIKTCEKISVKIENLLNSK